MSTTTDDYNLLSKELEQSQMALDLAQWRYHLTEAKKIELKIAQSQTCAHTAEADQSAAPARKRPGSKAKMKVKKPSSSRRRFLAEGPTTVIVRLLYENRAGMTQFEMQARNGIAIKGRVIRKIVNRLIAAKCAIREGKKVLLTETGIVAWEASPLFLRSSRNRAA